ncbi:hypothetical protein DYB37_012365, partial [Aphanomyces astaci]
DELDWSVSTIEDDDNGADENWREPAMAAVANQLDDSRDDLSTVLIGDPASPRSGDELDWSVSTIGDEAEKHGTDDDWREPAAPLVANQLDDSWDDLSKLDLLELTLAEAPESLSATTDRQPQEGGTEASMLSVIPEGDEGDVDNSWDDLSTVLIGDPASPRSGDKLDWSMSTIDVEAHDDGADDDWREPTAASVIDVPTIDSTWGCSIQLDWSVSMIEVEAHDDGADDDWREPAVAAVANKLDDSWDDLPLSSTSSVIDVSTLDSTWGCSILYSKDALSSILDNVKATETRRPSKIHPAMVQPLSAALAITGPPAHSLPLPKFCVPSSPNRTTVPTENERKAVVSPDQPVATNNATAPAGHIDGARPSVQVGRRRSYLSLVWETMWRILWVGYVMFAVRFHFYHSTKHHCALS